MGLLSRSARYAAIILIFQQFGGICRADAGTDLVSGFENPPQDTRPYCYWYWISDNISREGITKDIESMAHVGIGEAIIGNINMRDGKHGDVKALTDPWFDMAAFAIREGKRLGVKIGMFNCPGWSQSGGPWVKPDQAMRYVVSSEVHVVGPANFSQKLAVAKEPFQDIAVLAYPEPDDDQVTLADNHPKITCSQPVDGLANLIDGKRDTSTILPAAAAQQPATAIDLIVDKPFTARSFSIVPGPKRFSLKCELLAVDDSGKTVSIKSFSADRSKDALNVGPMPLGAVTVAFPEVTSKHFQLRIMSPSPTAPRGAADVAEIELSPAPRLERVVEKQLGKLYPQPHPAWDSYMWPTQAEPDDAAMVVAPAKIQNLSSQMKPDGTLNWKVPPGKWIITRIGMTPTGVTNSPASKEGTGLEIDKMNRANLPEHYNAYVQKVMDKLSPDEQKSAGHIIADSYEVGSENWTDGFEQVFKDAYGYDPVPWLPVLTGRLIGSATQSERFLWDMRRLVADRIATEYVGGLRDVLASHGHQLWLENYGHWGFSSEFMKYGGESSAIGGEFWMGSDLGSIEVRDAASSCHGYGKNRVSSEAFTTGSDPFQRTPWDLKTRGDWAMTEGCNHFVLHVYIHQAYEDKYPGMNAWFGTEFNRHNIWFNQASPWVDYFRRTQYMLSQGHYVADVAYFIGEDAPKMTGIRQPALPAGYSFDYINADLIEQAKIQDGRLLLPSGMSYRLLVLPPQTTMRPQLLKKIRDLIAAGGAVLGPLPTASPSLQDYPNCDQQVQQIAADLWKNCDGKASNHARYEKGDLFNGTTLEAAFDELKQPVDLNGLDASLPWIHRAADGCDIYFISNQTDDVKRVTPSFRVAGRQPEVWNAVNATHRDLPDFVQNADRTEVPLRFEPRQSLLIVFAKPIIKTVATKTIAADNFVTPQIAVSLAGPWDVSFDSSRGAPASIEFAKLINWQDRPEPAIQHYSGKAVYHLTFDAPKLNSDKPVYLRIGEPNGIAVVSVNGQEVGSIWCAPWQVKLTEALKPTGNDLQIDVYSTWGNQLIYDSEQPRDQRQTWLSNGYARKRGEPAQPSGLLEPVSILQ